MICKLIIFHPNFRVQSLARISVEIWFHSKMSQNARQRITYCASSLFCREKGRYLSLYKFKSNESQLSTVPRLLVGCMSSTESSINIDIQLNEFINCKAKWRFKWFTMTSKYLINIIYTIIMLLWWLRNTKLVLVVNFFLYFK